VPGPPVLIYNGVSPVDSVIIVELFLAYYVI